jgi:zinc D-Ala-D-Ala carboxypeptidase
MRVTDVMRDRRDLRRPSPRVRRNRVIALGIVGVLFAGALLGTIFVLAPHPQEVPVAETPSPTTTPTPTTAPTASTSPTPHEDGPIKLTFDRSQHSLTDPKSIWVVVNKLNHLDPKSYAAPDLVTTPVDHANPPVLRQAAADAVVEMFSAYNDETSNKMQVQSAYRSYDVQVSVYGGYAASEGADQADTHSARPGYSEHQSGLALDISALPAKCTLAACFADTDQGKWLKANSYKWGFILRYPKDLTDITGYTFEPWHYRYVGVELATAMHDTKIKTLEQFFDLPPAADYKD